MPEPDALPVVNAVFKFFCKNQTPNQTYLIKVPMFSETFLRLTKKALPEIKHMFSYRKNLRNVWKSSEKAFRVVFGDKMPIILWNIFPKLASRIYFTFERECRLFERFGISDMLDMVIIWHLAYFNYYFYKCRDIYDIPVINYEDLIADKKSTLKPVFELCQVPYEKFIDKALEQFEMDSQAESRLDQNVMKNIKTTEFDDRKMEKVKEVCEWLGMSVPEI